jgi:hypothetical protein
MQPSIVGSVSGVAPPPTAARSMFSVKPTLTLGGWWRCVCWLLGSSVIEREVSSYVCRWFTFYAWPCPYRAHAT